MNLVIIQYLYYLVSIVTMIYNSFIKDSDTKKDRSSLEN